jgi:hypothetical protein
VHQCNDADILLSHVLPEPENENVVHVEEGLVSWDGAEDVFESQAEVGDGAVVFFFDCESEEFSELPHPLNRNQLHNLRHNSLIERALEKNKSSHFHEFSKLDRAEIKEEGEAPLDHHQFALPGSGFP